MVKKIAKKRVSKPRTAIEAIQALRKIFCGLDDEIERSKFWDVLTALRGCDLSNNDALKYATTGIIRVAVFGRDVRERFNFHRAMFQESDSDSMVAERLKPWAENGSTYHFKTHVQWAFDVLGLDLSSNNGEIKPV